MNMNRIPAEDFSTKARKRDIKKRLRMKMHGKSLLKNHKFAGGKLAKKR